MPQYEPNLFIEELLFSALLSGIRKLSRCVETDRRGKHRLPLLLILGYVFDVFIYAFETEYFINGLRFGKVRRDELEAVGYGNGGFTGLRA